MTKYRKSWTQVLQEVRENIEVDESKIGTGDQEHNALVATKAKLLMKQALKGGKKQSQAWWDKQVKIAGYGSSNNPIDVIKGILGEEIKEEENDLDEAYGTVKITGKVGKKFQTYLPYLQHQPGEVVFVGNKKQATSKLKDLKKDGDFGYIMQGVTIKVGEKVKGLERGRSVWAGTPKMRKEDIEIDEKIDMDKPGSGGTLLKRRERDKYNKRRKGHGIEDEVELEAKEPAYPATVDTLRKIVKDKQNQVVMFKSGQARVDLFTASAMVQVYDALKKPDMKKHFEKMIADKAGFMKTQAFAMKMIG